MMTHRARSRARQAGVMLGLLVSLLSWNCKGGGDEGTSAAPCTDITFTAANTSPASGDVFMSQTGSTCTTLQVSVVVNDLTGIFTVGFDLNYPSTRLQYNTYTVGPLLQKSASNSPIVLVDAATAGLIKVAMSRVIQDGPVSAGSNEVLITFQFSKASAGTGSMDFNSSGSSAVTEEVLDQNGQERPASFGPNHGGSVMVP
jgi:hypothetical protein